MSGRARLSGFSLLEILIVISISAILLLIALPNFKIFFQEEELNSSTQAWINAIRATRYLAIKTQTAATLHWQENYTITQQDHVVREIHSLLPQIKLSFHASFSRDDTLTFLPNGFTQGQQGHFELCLINTSICRKIVVLSSGITRAEGY